MATDQDVQNDQDAADAAQEKANDTRQEAIDGHRQNAADEDDKAEAL